ncbi:MAG: transposase [Candidatus Latescibacteria bacterium]|nr:transposase [Candidatus Latescibacterota bacterium]
MDESHLHWGDACGYGWGRSDRRLEVAIENGRQRQTYYGALDLVKGTFLMQSYPKANSQHTVDFIRYLQQRRPGQKLLIF